MPADLVEGLLLLVGAHDNLVVNVSDVHAELNIISEVVSHNASEDVEAHVGLGVAQMRVVVDGWSAHVPGNQILVLSAWHKQVLLVG